MPTARPPHISRETRATPNCQPDWYSTIQIPYGQRGHGAAFTEAAIRKMDADNARRKLVEPAGSVTGGAS